MNLSDLSQPDNQDITEAPVGMIKQGLRNIGAKAAGAVGMKGTAAELSGRADAGREANQLYTEFRRFLGQSGGDINRVSPYYLEKYLNYNGYPTSEAFRGINKKASVIPKKMVDRVIMKAVENRIKRDFHRGTSGYTPGKKSDREDNAYTTSQGSGGSGNRSSGYRQGSRSYDTDQEQATTGGSSQQATQLSLGATSLGPDDPTSRSVMDPKRDSRTASSSSKRTAQSTNQRVSSQNTQTSTQQPTQITFQDITAKIDQLDAGQLQDLLRRLQQS